MGHMNIRWYMALFDAGGQASFAHMGWTLDFIQQNQSGIFALQHVIRYLAEVRLGDTVSIFVRILGRSEKRMHFISFMVNETQHKLAATLEGIAMSIDLNIRRSAPWHPELAASLDAFIEAHHKLNWDAPVCGFLAP